MSTTGTCPTCGDDVKSVKVESLPIQGRDGETVESFVCPECNSILGVALRARPPAETAP